MPPGLTVGSPLVRLGGSGAKAAVPGVLRPTGATARGEGRPAPGTDGTDGGLAPAGA